MGKEPVLTEVLDYGGKSQGMWLVQYADNVRVFDDPLMAQAWVDAIKEAMLRVGMVEDEEDR